MKRDTVFEYDRRLPARKPIFILARMHCNGAMIGGDGTCDRACAVLWHADWPGLGPSSKENLDTTASTAESSKPEQHV
jgi:hypothetical protein